MTCPKKVIFHFVLSFSAGTTLSHKFTLSSRFQCNWAKLNLLLVKSEMQMANYRFKSSMLILKFVKILLTISFLSSIMEMNLKNCVEFLHSESNERLKMNSSPAENASVYRQSHSSPSLFGDIYLWETVMWGEDGKAFCSKL